MNFLTGTIHKGSPNVFELTNGEKLQLNEIRDEWDQKTATIGIRPEHLEISEDGHCFSAEVAVTEPTGWETQIVARIAGQEVTALIHDRRPLSSGQVIKLRPRSTDGYHLFDSGSGERMVV